jgi:hypothetical protein
MKFSIGNQEIDAQAVSEGTYLSEKTGETLRQLTIAFTIRGINASEQYNHLVRQATKTGLITKDSDPEINWEFYDETGTTWEGQNDYMIYNCLWTLREKEGSQED